jgi:hypothetical protein
MRMKSAIAAISLALASPSAVAEERAYRDVYYDHCPAARRACEQDWGRGMCRIPSATLNETIMTSEVFFGDGGGGDDRPTCVQVGPIYSKQRASPVTAPVRMIMIDRKSRAVIGFGWLKPGEAGGG